MSPPTPEECFDFNIPYRLHRQGREEDQDFSGNEIIYRRFSKFDEKSQANILPDGSLSISIFQTKNMSCNRHKYSEESTDVLFNSRSPQHYFNWGIVSANLEAIQERIFQHPQINNKAYKLKAKHNCEECIFPHIEIIIMDGENEIEQLKPLSVKLAIRQYYREIFQIIKTPSDE